MKRDAIISLCIALPVANLPFWQWRSPAEMLLMVGLFWQVAFVAVVGTGYMFGGVVIGQFTRYIHMALVVGGKLLVVGSKAICLQVDA